MNEAEVTTEELRELIREGHTMIKDLAREKKEVRRLMGELRGVIQEAINTPRHETVKIIRDTTEEATKIIAVEVSDIANQATALVQEEIYRRFDVLMAALMGKDDPNGSIPDLIRAQHEKPKIDFDALEHITDPIAHPMGRKS